MGTLMSFLGAALALFAIFVLYIFGDAIAFRFFGRLLPSKGASPHEGNANRCALWYAGRSYDSFSTKYIWFGK